MEKDKPRGLRPPLDPRGNVLGHSDVLCANHFATVRVTRLSRAWRAPHCFHALCVLRVQLNGRTPATTRLPSLQNAGYSMSVTSPLRYVQYNRVRGNSVLATRHGRA